MTDEAMRVGEKVARKIFEWRGDEAEVRLSEHQLALIVAAALETGSEFGIKEWAGAK